MTDDFAYLILLAGSLACAYKWWQSALEAREMANQIARDTCSRAVVQLLDDTVAFTGYRWRRDAAGRRRLLRSYTFDYTHDGATRAQGFVVLSGARLHAVGLADSAV